MVDSDGPSSGGRWLHRGARPLLPEAELEMAHQHWDVIKPSRLAVLFVFARSDQMPGSSQFAPGRKGGCSLGILRPGCQVNVYMCTWSYLSPRPVELCLADPTLTLVRAMRTPKHQSPSLATALPPACRGAEPAPGVP